MSFFAQFTTLENNPFYLTSIFNEKKYNLLFRDGWFFFQFRACSSHSCFVVVSKLFTKYWGDIVLEAAFIILKLMYSEKATKYEKNLPIWFDVS